MTIKRLIAAVAALLAGTGTASAQVAGTCLTAPEAEAVIVSVLPDVVTVAGIACSAWLPANALMRQPGSAFLERYRAAGDAAWPQARAGLAKVAGEEVRPLLETEMARPMLAALIAPLFVKNIKPRDCQAANQLLTLLAPLPPRNAAGVAVTILQLTQEGRKPGDKGALPICPFVTR